MSCEVQPQYGQVSTDSSAMAFISGCPQIAGTSVALANVALRAQRLQIVVVVRAAL